MSEFKSGDKVLAEVYIIGAARVQGEERYIVTDNDKYAAETLAVKKDKVYPLPTKTYEDGLREAWETARRLNAVDHFMEMSTDDFDKLFGNRTLNEVFNDFSPQEAAAKIAEWERKQEIRVGDILQDKDTGKEVVVSHTESREAKNIFVIFPDGSCGECEAKDFTKTGRTINIAELLAQIGGEE